MHSAMVMGACSNAAVSNLTSGNFFEMACTSLKILSFVVRTRGLFVLFTYCLVWPIIKTLVNGTCVLARIFWTVR